MQGLAEGLKSNTFIIHGYDYNCQNCKYDAEDILFYLLTREVMTWGAVSCLVVALIQSLD